MRISTKFFSRVFKKFMKAGLSIYDPPVEVSINLQNSISYLFNIFKKYIKIEIIYSSFLKQLENVFLWK